MKINGEILFSAAVAVDKERAELSDMKLLDHKKESIARDLGMKIAEEKGWEDYEEGGLLRSDIRLYVFTPQELKDFLDIKYALKLKEIGLLDEDSRNR